MTYLLYLVAGLLIIGFLVLLTWGLCLIGATVDRHIEKAKGEWAGYDLVFLGDEKNPHTIISNTPTKINFEKERE